MFLAKLKSCFKGVYTFIDGSQLGLLGGRSEMRNVPVTLAPQVKELVLVSVDKPFGLHRKRYPEISNMSGLVDPDTAPSTSIQSMISIAGLVYCGTRVIRTDLKKQQES